MLSGIAIFAVSIIGKKKLSLLSAKPTISRKEKAAFAEAMKKPPSLKL